MAKKMVNIKKQKSPLIDIYMLSHAFWGVLWAWLVWAIIDLPSFIGIQDTLILIFSTIIIFEVLEKIYIEPHMPTWIPETIGNQIMDIIVSSFFAWLYLYYIGAPVRWGQTLLDALMS